jgi:hypothetical protein
MEQDKKERYVRWQDYRITQLSFSINLFLGFAVASLAYAINLKLNPESQHNELLVFIIKWWSWSAGFGCAATISRLLDFRYTAKKIKDGGAFNAFMAKWLGPITWGAFWGQLFTYVAGVYFFISGIVGI